VDPGPAACRIADVKAYLDLVRHVLEHGERKSSRTGVDTLSCFSAHYQVDLAQVFPLLTTKKMLWSSVLRELLWYLSGDDHIRNLREHTKIWDAWADDDGNLDTAYGHYWRHFPSASRDERGQWRVKEIDQIGNVLNCLRNDPNSRRMVVTAWEPGNAWGSKLPPCHYTYAFHVQGGKLNCHLTQRSGDVALGIPFNLAAYATLTQMLAQEVGLGLGCFSHTIVDAHIYCAKADGSMSEYCHIEGMKKQLLREPTALPKLHIADVPFEELTFEDFRLEGYVHQPAIRFAVAV